MLTKCKEIEEIPEGISWFRRIYSELKSSQVGEIASLITDSVIGTVESTKIDVGKLTKGVVSVTPALAIKRNNDAFTKFCFRQFVAKNIKIRLFLDEMHFAYRDRSALSADAALVRDTVLAVREINEKLIDNRIDSTIYMSIRSEFLEHHEISTADVSHTIESYGQEISWEAFPYNRDHPMFRLIAERLKLSLGNDLTIDTVFERYLGASKPRQFLQYTWGKPRDIVRFFKIAKDAYPSSASLQGRQYNNVLRRYCHAAWQDVKSALTAFIPKESVPVLEEALQTMAKHGFDKSRIYSREDIFTLLEKPHSHMRARGVTYDIEELLRLLYIIGVFYVQYRDANRQLIVHQFHRGNRRPVEKGEVHLHYAVSRAFS